MLIDLLLMQVNGEVWFPLHQPEIEDRYRTLKSTQYGKRYDVNKIIIIGSDLILELKKYRKCNIRTLSLKQLRCKCIEMTK